MTQMQVPWSDGSVPQLSVDSRRQGLEDKAFVSY